MDERTKMIWQLMTPVAWDDLSMPDWMENITAATRYVDAFLTAHPEEEAGNLQVKTLLRANAECQRQLDAAEQRAEKAEADKEFWHTESRRNVARLVAATQRAEKAEGELARVNAQLTGVLHGVTGQVDRIAELEAQLAAAKPAAAEWHDGAREQPEINRTVVTAIDGGFFTMCQLHTDNPIEGLWAYIIPPREGA